VRATIEIRENGSRITVISPRVSLQTVEFNDLHGDARIEKVDPCVSGNIAAWLVPRSLLPNVRRNAKAE
jgi:hypothetical protein